MFKNIRFVILFDILLNPKFKMRTGFANIARIQLVQVNLYDRKDFKSLGIGSLYEKQFLVFNELKTAQC